MKNTTLVIMAAGIGSRFGGGIKQLEPVGPSNEIIMDYSIYDALEAGFNKIVFVIRKSLEKDFKEIIGNRISKIANVDYVFQELDKVPAEFQNSQRTKPWGTGQAILCCKGIVNEPFGVINADDYYGKEAFVMLYDSIQKLAEKPKEATTPSCSLVGFKLCNTLSENGGVTRGLCKVDENMVLSDIQETTNIVKTDVGASVFDGDAETIIDPNSYVSMNMWGFLPEFIDQLEVGFNEFLNEMDKDDLKAEFLLPKFIGELMEDNKISVDVVVTTSTWFGVTYKEDKDSVVSSINELIEQGIYSKNLFE